MNDGITVSVRTTPAFDRGIAGLIYGAGINAKVVVKKESAEVIKTLVKISPKADPNKIRSDIKGRFNVLNNPSRAFEQSEGGIHGSGDVNWYAVDSRALYGVKKDADMREASVDQLKAFLYKTTKTGKIRGQRGRQAVYITQRITTRAATVTQLIAQKVRNRGRLAAGWCVAVAKGILQVTLPAQVARHIQGARGSFINGLETPQFPKFTIINTAPDINKRTASGFVQDALKIRAKAMATNALLFMNGKKNIADYAR